MCGGSKPKQPKERPAQRLTNPFMSSYGVTGSNGLGPSALRIELNSGRSASVSDTGSYGGTVTPHQYQIPTGGSQGSGEFTPLTYGSTDRDKAVKNTKAAKDKVKQDQFNERQAKLDRMSSQRGNR